MLDTLTLETFTPRRGERFRLLVDGRDAIDLTLSAVDALSEATAGRVRTPFSLTFHAATGDLVPQAIYRVEHDALPALDIFLVPLGPDGQGMRYEAIFT